MADLESQLRRWSEANLITAQTAERILHFEQQASRGRLRWPAILAVGFGALMLCAGILLFVAAHWEDLSPAQRFTLVLTMVAVFHVTASVLGEKVPAIGIALHVAGTVSLGAGIYLAGQIFNLEEHWPGGVMLWALGAVLGYVVLRQWPQALIAAVLIPWWLGGEWLVATDRYAGAWNVAAQGFLLLAIVYMSAAPREPNRAMRLGMVWIGALALLPFIADVVETAAYREYEWSYRHGHLPLKLTLLGYALAYLPTLALAWMMRRKQALPILLASVWVFALAMISRTENPEHNSGVYLWIAIGACALCYWGMRENRKLFINFGIVIFALDVITFYFSDVLDKLGRSMGLILLGVIFLAGGWVLNRLRTDLLARAAAAGGAQ
ncbi:MAG TPA: DUF2157 domain-containing protein [Candidatus Angelobacter sp.]|nr:DUF2157 domain-containing protein [Candidatus Angelobacter sp.]